jgi:hypothetical protein
VFKKVYDKHEEIIYGNTSQRLEKGGITTESKKGDRRSKAPGL